MLLEGLSFGVLLDLLYLDTGKRLCYAEGKQVSRWLDAIVTMYLQLK